jgi:hypothetical protein
MKKLKLMTIVGTRPEIIKMSAIIKKSDKYNEDEFTDLYDEIYVEAVRYLCTTLNNIKNIEV